MHSSGYLNERSKSEYDKHEKAACAAYRALTPTLTEDGEGG